MTNLLLPGQRFDNAFASVLNMDEPYFANFGEEPCTLLDELCWGRIEASLPDLRASEGAPYVTSTGPVGWVDIGKNDVALYGDPDASGGQLRRAWRNAWRANLAAGWAGGRFGPDHASMAYSGTWAAEAPLYAPYGLRVSTVSGASATLTVPGDYHGGFINLLFIGEPEGVTACAACSVTVPGGTPGFTSVDLSNAMPFGHGRVNLRFALPATGDPQDVTIANFGGGRLAFAGWSIEAANRPLLFAALIPTPADWSGLHPGGTPRGEGEVQPDDLYAALLNSYTTEVFAEFAPSGPCATVDLDPVINGTLYPELWAPDGVHLNAAGIPVAVAEVARAVAPLVAGGNLIGPREADELYHRPHGPLPADATRGWLPVPKAAAQPTGISAHDGDYVPLAYFDGSLWIDPEGDGNWVEFSAGTATGGGWLWGELLKGQRPPASADLLGLNFLAWDVHGGTHQVCNGTSWVDVAPGLSRPPLMHGDEAHLTLTVAEAVDALERVLTVSNTPEGPFPLDPRPEASADTKGLFHILLDGDDVEDTAALQFCNGQSWVTIAYLNPHPRVHGDEAHTTLSGTNGTGVDGGLALGNYIDRPEASTAELGRLWKTLDDEQQPLWGCNGQSWVDLAAASGHQHPSTVIIGTDYDSMVHVKDFGAVGDNVADDTAALNAAHDYALAHGTRPIWLGPGTSGQALFKIDAVGGLDWRHSQLHVLGMNPWRSKIIQARAGEPVMKIGHTMPSFSIAQQVRLDGFALTYPTRQSADTANCLEMTQLSNSWISRIDMINGTRGLYQVQDQGYNTVFSMNFEELYVNKWSRAAISMKAVTGGNTGSIFTNTYIANTDTVLADTLGTNAVELFQCTEMLFDQLNIEWGNVISALKVDSCRHIKVQSLHVEGLIGRGDAGAFVDISGAGGLVSRVAIDGADFLSCQIDRDNMAGGAPTANYALFRLLDANNELDVKNISEQNTVYAGSPTPVLRRLYGGPGFTGGSVRFAGQRYSSINTALDWSAVPGPGGLNPGGGTMFNNGRARPMVRRENDTFRHFVAFPGPTALPLTALHGYHYLPKSSGIPTAVPTDEPGCAPVTMVNGVLYAYTGGAWNPVGGGTVGDVHKRMDVDGPGAAGGGAVFISALSIPLLPGQKWTFDGMLFYEGESASNIKIGFGGAPADVSGKWGIEAAPWPTLVNAGNPIEDVRNDVVVNFASPIAIGCAGIGTLRFVRVSGYISNPTTAGALTPYYSKNTIGAGSDSRLLAASYLNAKLRA